MNEVLTLREAAERLGVHYMTVYRYVRLGLLPSHRSGRTWFITSDDLDVFSGNASERPTAVSRRTAPWHERLTNRLLAGDRTGSWKVVESAMTGGMAPLQVYDEMIVPALREIGDRWEAGAIGIDEEHQASVIVNRLIGRMGQNFATRGRQKGTVVLACPPGERHVLSLAMVADALRGGGYASLDLGGDTPMAALESALRRVDDVVAVCIGALHDAVLADARQMVLAARRNIARTCPVILGGGAIVDDAHARSLGADAKAELTTVVEAVELGRETQPTVQV